MVRIVEDKRKPKQSGQIAIFIALIFQVLFVFFALMVNIGLLVHHKINLQNSVDLAAYYGASKQAEVMNAISHINFQLRQSFKLLTFRYRHLGMFGDDTYPGKPGFFDDSDTEGSLIPAYCVLYNQFVHMNVQGTQGENYCRQSGRSPITLQLPPTPAFGGHGLFGFNAGFVAAIQQAQASIIADCRAKASLSIATLLMHIRAYKLDISQRKELLIHLANRISRDSDTMLDLDGQSVKSGVENTLKRNLTYQNKDTIQFSTYNSLSHDSCRNTGEAASPPKWLVEKMIWPIYISFFANCANPIQYFPQQVTTYDALPAETKNNPIYAAALQEMFDIFYEPLGDVPTQNKYRSTLGFEKNPWCMAYYGVKAEAKPKIPFAPFGEVTLQATSFAKPFGGTIGPWDRTQWSKGSPYSNGTKEVDPVAPIRLKPGENIGNPNDPRYLVDYSRYVGDKIGSNSRLTMTNYWRVMGQYPNRSIDLNWYKHLFDNAGDDLQQPGTNGDFLAWPENNSADGLKFRNFELSAIAPDQFDLAYYSVEPDFYRNYYLRLIKQQGQFQFPIRADLGSRHREPGSGWFPISVKDQLRKVVEANLFDFAGRITYVPKNFHEFLTSFKAISPDADFSQIDMNNNFGKCRTIVTDNEAPDKATPGNCKVGGRVGYSVKLVDGDFLKDDQRNIGGENSNGAIENPPPW